MRNSTAILATVALGAVLAIGSATASVARDAGNGGHGRGFGGEASSNSASAGDHAYGATIPFMANNGASVSSDHGFSFRHGFGGNRHVGDFRGRDTNGFHAHDLSSSYARDHRNNSYAWGPLFGFYRTRVTDRDVVHTGCV